MPQFGDFKASWHLLRHPVPAWTALAILLTGATYLAGAATYCLLAFRPLRYGRTVLVQFAAMFVNRLLPAGIGAVGTNYAYLRRERHTSVQAATVTVVNNIFGGLGHGLLVTVSLLLFSSQVVSRPMDNGENWNWIALALAAAIVLGVVGSLIAAKSKTKRKLAEIRDQLLSYRRRLWHLPAALLSSMALTTLNVLCLLCCALALGIDLPFTATLLILTFGVGAGAATPTPGGLGGFEAGLVAGFAAYGVDGSAALAAALLYRLVSYWLPLAVGAPAFIIGQKRKLFIA